MSEFQFMAGAAKRRISPSDSMGPVYRAGYKMGEAEEIKGIVDDIFLRCLAIEGAGTRVVFLSFDLIGLFRDFATEIASGLAPQGIKTQNLIVSATHMHSGPDTMGLWGPALDQSGYNEEYGRFLLDTAVDAAREAISSMRPARALFSFAEKNLGISNFREPEELNLALWQIRFEGENGCVGSLFSYPAQPELAPRDDDRISAGYPGEACRQLDGKQGGINLFLLGSCGGMEPEGCEKGYDEAHAYGKKLAEELLKQASTSKRISDVTLSIETEQVHLPVENPGFQMMMEMGVIRTSQRPPEVISTISKIQIGGIRIFAIPGESFPGIVRGIGKKGETLFIDQVNDSLGYFISPEQFRQEPVEWADGHHFTGHELESLGRGAGDMIRKGLLKLASK